MTDLLDLIRLHGIPAVQEALGAPLADALDPSLGASGPPPGRTRQQGWVALPDGSRGYLMERQDDCLRAAVSTCLQIPMEDVPDSHLDERVRAGENPDEIARDAYRQLRRWLDEMGLCMSFHREVPVYADRWIGVAVPPGADPVPFTSHCLVMRYAEVLHDVMPHIQSRSRWLWSAADITYGYSFNPKRR